MDLTTFRRLPMSLARFGLSSGLLALASSPLLGCAETQYPASKPAVVFPTRAEIAQIPAKPPAPAVFGAKDVAVDEWTVESPPLPSEGPYEDASPAGSLVRELMRTRASSVSLSPALRCAAAEIGRFYLKKRALPVDVVRRFIAARCGSETPNIAPAFWAVDAPPGVSDDAILARARDSLANMIEGPLAHGFYRVGLALVRDEKHAVVSLVLGEDDARLEPGTRSVDATRHVTLRGTARGEYAQIVGYVNRGAFGIARCEGDPRVHAPRFAVTCDLAPGDSFDWVEILGAKRGHVMLHPLADVMVYEGDPSAVRYKARTFGAPAPVMTPPSFTSALLERVNRARGEAKMPPLVLGSKQSAENERLAGTILDAAVARDDDSADKAAIGLLAGWDVEGGTIRGGQFYLGTVAPTNDASAWLESASEQPIGRMALFAPEARVIAIGPSVPEGGQGLGAVVTTYSLFDSDDHAADEALFFRRIEQVRAARGRGASVRVAASEDMRKLAARVRSDEMVPQAALNEMLTSVSSESGAPAMGYVLETNDLTSADVPEPFLAPARLGVALAITHHRAPGAAWGQYVVFLVLSGGEAAPVEATRGVVARGAKVARLSP